MFRLIRFLLWCLFWFLFAWLAVTVPLGKYTLFQHVMRIVRTKEAQELKEGLQQTAHDTEKKIQKELKTQNK